MADILVYTPVQKRNRETEFDKFIKESSINLKDAGTDFTKRSLAINQICTKLIKYNDVSRTEIAIEHLSKEHDVKRHIWQNTIKRIKQEQLEDEQRAIEMEPMITRVENFITYNYDIRFNVISLLYECKSKGNKRWEELNVNNIWRNLQKHHIDYSPAKIQSLIKSDFTTVVNPINEYFENLDEWDGTDYIEKLCSYISVSDEDRERFNRHMKKMFVRVIASALGIAFNKHALIFVHEGQSSGKSTFMRWLCPKKLQDYYTEDINTDKDGLIALSQNIFVNLDELAAFTRSDMNTLKSFMSKDMIKVRIPYDRSPTLVKRRSSFFGSTNSLEFLTDPTGSVRWICFRLVGNDPINWSYKNELSIDKIWAQAFYLYTNQFEYQLTKDEIIENEFANVQFFVRTTEIDLIQKYFEPAVKDLKETQFMTASDIVTYLNKVTESSFTIKAVDIGKAMAFLGFQRVSEYQKNIGFSIKGYRVKIKKEM